MDHLITIADLTAAPSPAPAPVAAAPRSVSLQTLVLSVLLTAVFAPSLQRLVPSVVIVHEHLKIGVVLDFSGSLPAPVVPPNPLVPPVDPPAPVVTGPIHVTLVTDPAADSQANQPIRSGLAIKAAFPALNAIWHHLTTDSQVAANKLTPHVASTGKPSLIVQSEDGALIIPPSKAPDTDTDVVALVKSLRGSK